MTAAAATAGERDNAEGDRPAGLIRDPWLSRLLGKPGFHLAKGAGAPAEVLAALQGPCFVDAKVPAEETAAAAALQEAGFRLADTNVRLHRPAGMAAAPFGRTGTTVRFAVPQDRDAVAAIAASALRWDRFHRDPAIPGDTADRIKAEWAANFFSGRRGDWMVVAEREGRPAGFLQLLKGSDGSLVIDLVAVAPDFQGHGLGRAMIEFAAVHCPAPAGMLVGTQLANRASLLFYARLGFGFDAASHIFHFHGPDGRRAG